MALEAAPGSPPDLTNSKSSKSSSFHSSSLSDIAGSNDISHFEDINLDDLHATLPSDLCHSYATSPEHGRPVARTSVSPARSNRSSIHTVHSFRDLTNGAKPRYPSLKGQVSSVTRGQSNLNTPRTIRRGFSSPSAPSLTNQNLYINGRRSRSPSPTHPQVFSTSPKSLSRRSSRTNLEVSPMASSTSRRQSWQPGTRKTVEEREAEYDELDEELPEDAIVWNIPISPRPTHERSAPQSPQHISPSLPPSGLGSDTPAANSMPSPVSNTDCGSSAISLSSSISNTGSENVAPSSQTLGKTRTQSWHQTFSSLDPDARDITEALEAHQEESVRKQESQVQNGETRTGASEEAAKIKSPMIELPPLRKGDPLIDPLAISKEKEKVLSRTRPSWLPPKDPKEEKKHLKEYQTMMAYAEAAEKRKLAKIREEQLRLERIQKTLSQMWENHIIPNWAGAINSDEYNKKTRHFLYLGIPPKFRGQVWKKAVGNELHLKAQSYYMALERVRVWEVRGLGPEGDEKRDLIDAAEADMEFTFPELNMFQRGKPLHEDLVDVVKAYIMYRSDLKVIVGIHGIAAILLLNMSAPDAFICLANILNRPLPMAYLVKDSYGQMQAHKTTLGNFERKLPNLHKHFDSLQYDPNNYLVCWFESLFTRRLSLDHVCRVFDAYVFEGDAFLVRTAIAILSKLEIQLYGCEGDIRNLISWDNRKPRKAKVPCWDLGSPDSFMDCVREAGKTGVMGQST